MDNDVRKMTVADLVAKLQTFDQSLPVRLQHVTSGWPADWVSDVVYGYWYDPGTADGRREDRRLVVVVAD